MIKKVKDRRKFIIIVEVKLIICLSWVILYQVEFYYWVSFEITLSFYKLEVENLYNSFSI